MNRLRYSILFLLISLVLHGYATQKIDSKAMVNWHNITYAGINDILALGNWKFCFGIDATGKREIGIL